MKNHDVIIVLGGGRYNDGSLTELSIQRLDAGIELYKNGVSPKIFALGGKFSNYRPDAICFKETGTKIRSKYLQENGIPKKDIILVPDGRDTIFEAIASRKICQKLGYKKILVVTSDKHLPRALCVFKKVFGDSFQVGGFGTPCGYLINENAEKDLLKLFQSYFSKYSETIPDFKSWGDWYKENYYYYYQQTDLHIKHHQMGNNNFQAYEGIK